jgi:hypothetical protein
MEDVVKATTQYRDLTGTISIDGWDGLSVTALGARYSGKGYWPVGISFYDEKRSKDAGFDIDVYVYAVDTSILSPGNTPDAIREYAKDHGQLPVFRFAAKLDIHKLLSLVKRGNIVLQHKCTEEVPMVLASGDQTFHLNEEE